MDTLRPFDSTGFPSGPRTPPPGIGRSEDFRHKRSGKKGRKADNGPRGRSSEWRGLGRRFDGVS